MFANPLSLASSRHGAAPHMVCSVVKRPIWDSQRARPAPAPPLRPENKSQKCCPAVPTVLTARVTDPGNKIKMPEMATEAVDAVALLFEAYKKEHKSSTLTLPQFRQVRAPCPGGGLPLCSSHALPM